MIEKTVNAVQARKQFGRLLEEVFYQGKRVIVERAGRPMAVLVPLEEYQRWQEKRASFFAMVDTVQEHTRDFAPEDMEDAIAEAVTAARSSQNAGATG